MTKAPTRRLWSWHRWLGVAVLLPVIWWAGTAIVFALRPIDEIRGRTWSTGRKAEPARLTAAALPAPAGLQALSLTARVVEGRELLLVERGEDQEPELLELPSGRSLGPALPLDLALASARRDFAGPFEVEAAWLYPRHGPGRRVLGRGPESAPAPEEYAGQRPVYGFELAGAPGMHLYVDALDGEVRARRTGWWRLYDFAFQLHALDFLPDAGKRLVLLLVATNWLALGVTGLRLAVAWWRRRRQARVA